MSEERTPIEELIEAIIFECESDKESERDEVYYKGYKDVIQLIQSKGYIDKDKAYRYKYKHTKEDVIRIGQEYGYFVALCEREGRPLLLMEDWFKQYYNETHNK